MLLADVDAGSNTPSLVGKVMEWRKKKPEWAKQLYNVLATSNQSLADALLSLKMTHDTDAARYHETLDKAAGLRSKAVSSGRAIARRDGRLLKCSLLPHSCNSGLRLALWTTQRIP
jgi:phosphomevalonate kinase